MQSKDAQMLAEKRAYYRLLRSLLSEKVEAVYKPDTSRIPSDIAALLSELETRELPAAKKA